VLEFFTDLRTGFASERVGEDKTLDRLFVDVVKTRHARTVRLRERTVRLLCNTFKPPIDAFIFIFIYIRYFVKQQHIRLRAELVHNITLGKFLQPKVVGVIFPTSAARVAPSVTRGAGSFQPWCNKI